MNRIPFIHSREMKQREWVSSRMGNPLSDKKQIVEYLRSGYCVSAVPSIERDSCSDGKLISDPPHIYTDGVWLWVLTTAYWVEAHDLDLPSRFLDHARENQYVIPTNASDLMKGRYKEEYPWINDPQYFWPDDFKS